MIKLPADMELKDNIVVAMPKITREGHYTCNVRVEYEWKPPRCSSCKVFGHTHEECLKNTGAGEKKPSQTSRGVPVGLKMGFKPQKEYRPFPKKPNGSSSGNKKKGVKPTIEISNSNPFDVLNSIDNDLEFDTNRGTTNLVNNEASSSGSSFMNIDNDGEFASNTPIGETIDKIKRQICEGKLRLLDNYGKPLVSTGILESDSEVEVIFDETANLRISTSDNDDYDPYDDDMYENHDLSEHCSLFPLPAAVSPTAELPGYITDSEPEIDPEEEDGDDEKSEGDSIDYPTNKGDDDADDLSEDDANEEDEEESSDSKEEEEKHLALIVPAPALHSSISASEDSDRTELLGSNN
nr:hypothetical protein [Tanacetum cinerariifolium]